MSTTDAKSLPDEYESVLHKFRVGGQKGYVTVGVYGHDPGCELGVCVRGCRHGQPGEVQLRMAKPDQVGQVAGDDADAQVWSMLRGLADVAADAISRDLQRGETVVEIAHRYRGMSFAPSGQTDNPEIPRAISILNYLVRWLVGKFGTDEDRREFGVGGRVGIAEATAAMPAPLVHAPVLLGLPGRLSAACGGVERAEAALYVDEGGTVTCPRCVSATSPTGMGPSGGGS